MAEPLRLVGMARVGHRRRGVGLLGHVRRDRGRLCRGGGFRRASGRRGFAGADRRGGFGRGAARRMVRVGRRGAGIGGEAGPPGHGLVPVGALGQAVPDHVALAAGLAFANWYREGRNVSLTYFGEGASNQGQVYESFNLAALMKLPCVYIIENNKYAMGTSLERGSASRDLSKNGEPLPRLADALGDWRAEVVSRLAQAGIQKRGACHLFYDRLPQSRLFERAPAVWVSGDLHLENFGSYKGDNRLVYFDVNDFDEAVLAPLTWELVRFLSSVLVGAPSLKVTPPEALALCHTFLDAYTQALAHGKARWLERETAQGMVAQLLTSAQTRLRPAFLDTRTELVGRKRRIRLDGKKALPLSKGQRDTVLRFMQDFAAQQDNPRFFKVLDVARRIAGTGSLGVDRYILLVTGKGSPEGNYLLDLKAAQSSSLTPHLKVKQPRWPSEAHRVVAIQQRFQAVSMAFLKAMDPAILNDSSDESTA